MNIALPIFVKRVRAIVAKTQNVMALLFVDAQIVQITLQHTVVPPHAIMTLNVTIKNATLTSINVDLIPTAHIGHSAVRHRHALTARVTVMMIWNVMVHLFVVLTIAPMEQHGLIVVNRKHVSFNTQLIS